MDARQYLNYKEKNAVELKRMGKGAYQAVAKQFDPRDGTEVEPAIIQIDLQTLEDQATSIRETIEDMKEDLEAVEALINDVKTVAVEGGDDPEQIKKMSRRQRRDAQRAQAMAGRR